MKLYLILDNEKGNKIERTVNVDHTWDNKDFSQIVSSMIETMQPEFDPSQVDISPDDEVFKKQPEPLSDKPY